MSNFEKLQNLLSRQLNLDYKLIKADTCFREELGMEEIEIMELKLAIELNFHIVISYNDLNKLITVGDLVTFISMPYTFN